MDITRKHLFLFRQLFLSLWGKKLDIDSPKKNPIENLAGEEIKY
jgi:hypothetical protein